MTNLGTENNHAILPYLKWPGGKRRFVDRLKRYLHGSYRLVEPFVGSGSVFLGLPNFGACLCADINADVISSHSFIRDEGEMFIESCAELFIAANRTAERYYELRARFNSFPVWSRERAVLFIWLNRHCYRGLVRYNKKGIFNSPYGATFAELPRAEMMAFIEASQRAEFRVADFRDIMMSAKLGDVVYCDPPYLPLSQTASFAGYAAGGFSRQDHIDLAGLAHDLADRGIPVLVSNHDIPLARQIYGGATFETFYAARQIGTDRSTSRQVPELLAAFGFDKALSDSQMTNSNIADTCFQPLCSQNSASIAVH